MSKTYRFVLAVAGASVALTGCSSTNNGGAPSEPTSEQDASFATEFSVHGGLAELDNVDTEPKDPVLIHMVDFDQASAAADIPALSPDSTPEEIRSWAEAVGSGQSGAGISVTTPEFLSSVLADPEAISEEFGWSFGAVDRYSEAAVGSERFTVLAGQVSWPEGLPEVAPGVKTVGEGDDYASNPDSASRLRITGRPLRVGERDGLAAASWGTPPLEEWVDGAYQSFADSAGLEAAAESLDSHDVFSATLAQRSFGIETLAGMQGTPETLEKLSEEAVDEPFSIVGTGLTATEDGLNHVIVYVFDSPEVASAAQPQLETIWTTKTSSSLGTNFSEIVDSPVFEQDGQVVMITAAVSDSAPPQLFTGVLFNGDLAFLHD